MWPKQMRDTEYVSYRNGKAEEIPAVNNPLILKEKIAHSSTHRLSYKPMVA